jgi:hypothetical protein
VTGPSQTERRSVRIARRLFAYRSPRFVFVLATFPFVAIADRIQGVDPPARLRTGLRWARTGAPVTRPSPDDRIRATYLVDMLDAVTAAHPEIAPLDPAMCGHAAEARKTFRDGRVLCLDCGKEMPDD